MKKLAVYSFLFLLHFPLQVQAVASPLDNLRDIGEQIYGTGDIDIKKTIGNIVQVLLGFVGTIFIILIIVAGVQWMTSGGNEEKIKQAKRHLVNATIGLTIVFMAYAIAYSVTKWLGQAATAV